MPPRDLLRGFLSLWVITGVVLLVGSVETVYDAAASAGHHNPHLVLLGGVEAIAAVLFLVPRAMMAGAWGLIVTIALAFLVHIALGQFRGDLLVYAVAVAFVAIHGPLTREELDAALHRVRAQETRGARQAR